MPMPSFTYRWSLDECIGGEITIRTNSERDAPKAVQKIMRERLRQLGLSWTIAGNFDESKLMIFKKEEDNGG